MGAIDMGLDRAAIMLALDRLALDRNDFVIFGSGPMLAHDLRQIHDLDIVARGAAWKRARELGTPAASDKPLVCLVVDGVEIEIGQEWYSPRLWRANELIDNAVIIADYRFARLEYVREYKWALGRAKDLRDIAIIDAFLTDRQSSR